VRSASSSLAAVLLGAALAGCSTPAPQLPPETASARKIESYSASDAQKTCDQIAEEWGATSREREAANQNIAANRHQNQVAGYIGAALFPPVYLATEGNYADKERLAQLQDRRDTLIDLARTKNCKPLS
jgi:hypothetical protein